jgi:hypothetical protein
MDVTAAALLLCHTHDKFFRIRKYLFVLLNGHAQPERIGSSLPVCGEHRFAVCARGRCPLIRDHAANLRQAGLKFRTW